MTSLDVNDLFDRPHSTPRIPNDAFESRLFFEHIQRTIEGWAQNTYKASVLRGDPVDGRWRLIIAERHAERAGDAPITVGIPESSAWPRSEEGRIWIEDRNGRPVVAWEVAGQRNDGTYAPANPWGQT